MSRNDSNLFDAKRNNKPIKDFINESINIMCSNFSADVLSIYNFSEKNEIYINNVFDAKYEKIYSDILSLQQLISLSLVKEDLYIYQYNYEGIDFLSLTNLNKKYKLTNKFIIDIPSAKGIKEQLTAPFSILFCNYEGIFQDLALTGKVVFKKNQFNETIANKDYKGSDKLIALYQQQLEDLQDSKSILIDKDDEYSTLQIDFSLREKSVLFAYSEIARILQIPKSKLFGDSVSGLNSSGNYEKDSYEMKLESYRKTTLDPFLQMAGIDYVKIPDFNSNKVSNILNIMARMNIQISEREKRKIYESIFGLSVD